MQDSQKFGFTGICGMTGIPVMTGMPVITGIPASGTGSLVVWVPDCYL